MNLENEGMLHAITFYLHLFYIPFIQSSLPVLSTEFWYKFVHQYKPARPSINLSVFFFHRTFFVRGRLLWYGVNDVIRPSYQFYHTPRTSSYKFYISSLGNFVWYVIYLYVQYILTFILPSIAPFLHPILFLFFQVNSHPNSFNRMCRLIQLSTSLNLPVAPPFILYLFLSIPTSFHA